MANIKIITNHEVEEGKIIRYIKYENANYIIYTLEEKDLEGYQRLYINKILDEKEVIINDEEWDNLKKIIPPIVKEIRNNNIRMFEDLAIEKISEINTLYSRIFKLKVGIVNEITKKTESEKINLLDEELENIVNNNKEDNELDASLNRLDEFLKNPITNDDDIELPQKPLLEEETYNKEELINKIKQLEDEIQYYKNKLNNIKKLIEE